MAVKIAEIWETELEEFKANTLEMPRFLAVSMETRFLQAVIMANEVKFEFTKIVSWVIDFLNLVPAFTRSYEEMAETNPEVIEEHGHLSLTDILQTPDFFIGYIFVKCKTSQDVIELINAFDSSTGQKEIEIWGILKQTNVNFSLLIDKLWLDDIDNSQHDWSINLEQLDYVINIGKKRKMDDFVIEASISKAIIYREYLEDSNSALVQLDNCNAYLEYINPHTENYRAMIFHLDNKDEDALTIWKKYLPKIVKQKRYGRPYFVRNAEISASRLNDWEEVNRLALIGEQLSDKTYDGFPETSAVNIVSLCVMHPVNQAARLRVARRFSNCSFSNALGVL
jgi:hypothetical protein